MKVLHFVSGDGWAGAEKVLALLVKGCREQSSLEIEALLLNEGPLAASLRGLGLRVEVLPEAEHSFLDLALELRRRVARGGFDVVHVHRYKEILIAALALPRRCSLVVTVHGLEPWRQVGPRRALRTWASLWAAHLTGASFISVSRELWERLAGVLIRARVVQISNPSPPAPTAQQLAACDDLHRRFGWRPELPLVGFAGRLEEVKGADLFLQIASMVRSAAGFVVIGDGSLAAPLRTRASEADLQNRVGFTGEVPDARPYLAQLDVLAAPSRHEGLPLALLEAACLELPVVAFDVGGVSEVLDGGPAAALVPATDLEAFAAALEACLRDPGEARAAAASWAESVRQRFSLESAVVAHLSLYRASLDGRRSDSGS
jgi:glycosyltransferase involved in cell wall biosynthesis